MRIGLLYTLSRGPRGKKRGPVSPDTFDRLPTVKAIEALLRSEGHKVSKILANPDLPRKLLMGEFDLIFNLTAGMGPYGTKESIPPYILEIYNIPYTGAAPVTMDLCQNRLYVKFLLKTLGVPTPKFYMYTSFRSKLDEGMHYPLIVKNPHRDSGIGYSHPVVYDDTGLRRAIRDVTADPDKEAFVEEYISGRELRVVVLGTGGKSRALPPLELVPRFLPVEVSRQDKPPVAVVNLDYVTKCPAELTPAQVNLLKRTAITAYNELGGMSIGVVSIILRGRTPYVIRVNPNPDLHPERSPVIQCARAAKVRLKDILDIMIKDALKRRGKMGMKGAGV